MIVEDQKKSPTDFNAINKAIRIYIRNIDKASPIKIDSDNIT